MNRYKNHLIAAAVLSVLAVIGTIMNSHQAAAQGPPSGLAVNIVNPVPVPVTGSTTVSGAVAATQSGPWNVGIVGVPTFTLSGTPSVNIVSTPFSQDSTDLGGNPGDATGPLVEIPIPGKQRLEIEFLSCQANSFQAPQAFEFIVTAEALDNSVVGVVGEVKLFARDSFSLAGISQLDWGAEARVLMHVPAGGKVGLRVLRSVAGIPWGAACTVAGHLVSVP